MIKEQELITQTGNDTIKLNLDQIDANDTHNLSDVYADITNNNQLVKLALIIEKNTSSLTSLHIDGALLPNGIFLGSKTKNLANAIRKCQQLRCLRIENFGLAFRDYINKLASLFIELPSLKYLSFNNTALGKEVNIIFGQLSRHQTIQTLDLTNTFFHSENIYHSARFEFGQNSSLEVLILDNNPISPSGLKNLREGILCINNQLKVLQWRPHSFETNKCLITQALFALIACESLLTNMPLSSIERLFANAPTNEENKYLDFQKEHIAYLRNSIDYSISEEQFEQACTILQDIQSIITKRNHPANTSELIITVNSANSCYLECIAGQIMMAAMGLRKLTITFDPNETFLTPIHMWNIPDFQKALAACKNLEEIAMLNFKNTFFRSGIPEIIGTLEQLPHLTRVRFAKTYLSITGFNSLMSLLRSNKITYLNLDHCGLVDVKAYDILASALASNTSLKSLDLGKSPMVPAWLKPLVSVIRDHRKDLTIYWKNSPAIVMQSVFNLMCEHLITTVPPVQFLPKHQLILDKAERYFAKLYNERKTFFFSTVQVPTEGVELNTLSSESTSLNQPTKTYGSV